MRSMVVNGFSSLVKGIDSNQYYTVCVGGTWSQYFKTWMNGHTLKIAKANSGTKLSVHLLPLVNGIVGRNFRRNG